MAFKLNARDNVSHSFCSISVVAFVCDFPLNCCFIFFRLRRRVYHSFSWYGSLIEQQIATPVPVYFACRWGLRCTVYTFELRWVFRYAYKPKERLWASEWASMRKKLRCSIWRDVATQPTLAQVAQCTKSMIFSLFTSAVRFGWFWETKSFYLFSFLPLLLSFKVTAIDSQYV